MARPFSALPGILDRRSREFSRGVNTISREAAQAAGRAAVRSTPVDTGMARSNWQASTGSPRSNVIPPYAPGAKLGLAEVGNAVGAEGQQRVVLQAWNAIREISAFITNNVEYIGPLNFGGPTVGPNNMIAKAVQAWSASIRRPRRILR